MSCAPLCASVTGTVFHSKEAQKGFKFSLMTHEDLKEKKMISTKMSSFSSLKDIRQLVREADNLQRLGTIRLCSHYYYVSTDSLVQAKIFIAAAKLKCSDVARLRVKGVNNVFLKRFGISKLYGDLDYVGRVA